MPKRSYLLWVTGADRPGFVAAVTKKLFQLGCNLEDSSMMRLGTEFAMFLILSTEKSLVESDFSALKKSVGLRIGLKKISHFQANYKSASRSLFIVRVYGPDHPGIVYRVTDCLAKHGFDISDLSTHQTTAGKKAGYILLIEGELRASGAASRLRRSLKGLGRLTKTKISFDPLPTASL